MNIVIPIEKRRFYYNRKINCLPAAGEIRYGELHETLNPRKPGLARLGARRVGVPQLLELGQRLRLPARTGARVGLTWAAASAISPPPAKTA